MAFSLPSVLAELGIHIEESNLVSRTPGITCLGTITRIERAGSSPVSEGSFVWHAEAGWAPIDRMEMERWIVDAPSGTHWMISERKLIELSKIPTVDGVELTLWPSEVLATWVGTALLRGRLHLHDSTEATTSTFTSIINRTEESSPPPPKAVALKPKVNLTDWLRGLGYERLPVRPVLLEGRLWDVSGHLVGPEEAREGQTWSLLDDPFLNTLTQFSGAEVLPFVPQLEKVAPMVWKSRESIRSSLPAVCEERRHWRVNHSPSNGSVQGSILHWWRIDEKSAELSSSPVLIPAWQVDFPDSGSMLVHGLTGDTVHLPPSVQH